MVLFLNPRNQITQRFIFWVSLWKTCSQLGGRGGSPSILEASAGLSLGCPWCRGLLRGRGLEASVLLSKLGSSFANSRIAAQRALTTNTVLDGPPGWPVTMEKWHDHNFKMTVLWQSSHCTLELPAQAVDLEYYENICILKCCELYQIILNISFAILMNQSRAYHIISNHHGENGFQCT